MTNSTAHAADHPTLTLGALAALQHAGFSRRLFLKGAGALIVSFSAGTLLQTVRAQGPETADAAAPSPMRLDSWLAIAADGGVTAYTGKEELGQGISTAQIQLVAEELCVPFSRVQLIYCDTAMTPDQGVTSGSQSHPANFNHSNLAQAAATDMDRQDLKSAPIRRVVFVKSHQIGHGSNARPAPVAPKIEQQPFSPEIG